MYVSRLKYELCMHVCRPTCVCMYVLGLYGSQCMCAHTDVCKPVCMYVCMYTLTNACMYA